MQATADRGRGDPDKSGDFLDVEVEPFDENERFALTARQRGNGAQHVESALYGFDVARTCPRVCDVTRSYGQSSKPLPVEVQCGPVQVTLRGVHRSDVVPPRVCPDERVLREIFGFEVTFLRDKPEGKSMPYMSPRKAIRHLGWRPTPLVEGIKALETQLLAASSKGGARA